MPKKKKKEAERGQGGRRFAVFHAHRNEVGSRLRPCSDILKKHLRATLTTRTYASYEKLVRGVLGMVRRYTNDKTVQ